MFVGFLNESHLERCEASRNFYGSVSIFGALVGEWLGSLLGHFYLASIKIKRISEVHILKLTFSGKLVRAAVLLTI